MTSENSDMVWAVEWTEYERGWGSRPDGFSFHRTPEGAKRFISDYWLAMPDEVPDEYSRPESELKQVRLTNEEVKNEVEQKGYSRVFKNDPKQYYNVVLDIRLNAL